MKFALRLSLVAIVDSLDNGLGLTPPMGFNPWNCFGILASGQCHLSLPWEVPGPYKSCHGFSESVILDVAKAIANGPLKEAGYEYVNLDCGYSTGFRDENGDLVVNTTIYPHGMKWLGDQIHSLGLKFGIYSDAGTAQCCSRFYPGANDGSAGFEEQDARAFASWGVDYLKHDNCNRRDSSYEAMRDALNATGRPMYYSIHSDGDHFFDGQYANCWRTGGDIGNSWDSILTKARESDRYADRAGPGSFNDPDMLEVGNLPLHSALGDAEGRSHFSIWAAQKAPLLLGNDVTNLTATTLETLTNREVIAVNQDPLGIQAKIFPDAPPELLVLSGPLSGGRHVLLVVNMRDQPADLTVDLGWAASGQVQVRELWTKQDLGTKEGELTAKDVGGHDCVMYVLTSAETVV